MYIIDIMNIRDRLKIYDSFNKPPEPAKRTIASKVDLSVHPGYSTQETPFGPIYVHTRILMSGYEHGNIVLNQFRNIDVHSLTVIGRSDMLSKVDLQHIIFFDTETTGLSGGTGNYIFLAGLGYFEETQFVVKQFFLRDYDEEAAFLSAINEVLQRFECLVSYNGKSYDWPLFRTRLMCTRFRPPSELRYHIDMLHHVRRLWKRRLGSCSLDNIERDVLGYFRYDDTPGYLIPSLYFNYLRNYDFEPLKGVIEHNVNDIVSLAALIIKFDQIVKDPGGNLDHFLDLYSLASYYDQLQRYDLSVSIYKELLGMTADKRLMNDAKLKLGYCYKRLNEWDLAVRIWEDAIENGGFQVDAYVELAKYHEHRSGELDRAISIIERALASIDVLEELRTNREYSDQKVALKHRLERLTEKIARFRSHEDK